ncbi:hypothetical protein MLD38_033108 [Melastoma candidum]|uniref:Uncharacterized protein n=1 Tax=Melastoma candidum TaxID=119954 RepID=A0ACB9M698_9MYRT|nr:hypothetical protein MLD38_033108 [Melastoma candidum]
MIDKFLKVPKLRRFSGKDTNEPAKQPATEPCKFEERSASKVRIVHAGGKVEVYFMAIPAYRVMEKYPSHIIAWPEVFQRPWDSVLMPDEILSLGKKYYLVPRWTVKKLRRRVLNPNKVSHDDTNVTGKTRTSESSNDLSVNSNDDLHSNTCVDTSDVSYTSGRIRAGRRRNIGTKQRVRFKGIDDSWRRSSPDVRKLHDKEGREEGEGHEGLKHKPLAQNKTGGGKRKPKSPALTWQPSLASITETTHE